MLGTQSTVNHSENSIKVGFERGGGEGRRNMTLVALVSSTREPIHRKKVEKIKG